MLSRFSVKKPYIVTVAVIIILILGVSLTKMKTDLLPDNGFALSGGYYQTLALALKRWNSKLPMYWKLAFEGKRCFLRPKPKC